MKSFSQFWEEATLSDLERKHAQSAEGKQQARLSARKRAEAEAARRREAAKRYTKRKREEMLAKKRKAQVQQQDTENHNANQGTQQTHNPDETGRKVRQAIGGTAKLGVKVVKRIRKTIRNRRQQAQSNQNP